VKKIKLVSITCLLCFIFVAINAQNNDSRYQAHIALGQYPVSLITPKFNPLHPGVNIGIDRQWNKSTKHQLSQSANLAWFYHPEFQTAIQLFSEFKYKWKMKNGIGITPFAIGGGYVLSISDLTTLEWDETTETYIENKFPVRNNWLISLGASIDYESSLQVLSRPITFFADYRIQVQGIIVQQTIPVLIYSPVRFGISVPFQKIIKEN
jgi:hypothetical protein